MADAHSRTHTLLVNPQQEVATAIETRIFVLRGQPVMLDVDLADLYGVETRALLQAVRRNRTRFPADFLFSVASQELAALRSQFVISNDRMGRGGRRYKPYAFTEQGVAMLSSVLRSDTAVRVNIEIMRAFVRLRRAAIVSSQLMGLIEDLSKRVDGHDHVIADIVESIRQLVDPPTTNPSRPIGFTADVK
jgi:hypothetical protein